MRPASIHELYIAMGKGQAGGFTVPAMNLRMMTYDTARAVFRAAKACNAGAFIFEIARSEIGYTEQRPHEYAASVLAAAIREGHTGPVFFQGDHVQVNAKKYASPDRNKELETLRGLIREEIAAGFYNIDIDTSTLVDLDKPTLEAQQHVNCDLCADFTAFIRDHEPDGVIVSVGGEIGEVGGKNSDVHELHAFMRGYLTALAKRGVALVGISKISVQTGTAHGGFVAADGKVRTDVKLDLDALQELSTVARNDYGLGGAVQHGASTLPPDAFDAFPKAGACEIHLATDFQNMVYEHAAVPGGPEGRDVRVDARARVGGAQAERHRAAVHLQGPQEGDRAVQAADLVARRVGSRRHRRDASGAVRLPDEEAEHRRHRGSGQALRDRRHDRAEPPGRSERGRGHHHGGREKAEDSRLTPAVQC